jgi:hypothetical protein
VEEIPVEVVRDGDDPASSSAAADWRRWVIPVCAAVVALAAVAVAWSQLQISRAMERDNCMQEAQYATFFRQSTPDEDEFRELLARCGVELPASGEDVAG